MPFNQSLQIPNTQGSSTVLSNSTGVANFGNTLGVLGSASTTTDVNTVFEITQSTADINITLANPTINVAAGKVFTIKSSIASTGMFFMYGASVFPGQTLMVLWNGTVFSAIAEPVASKNVESVSTATYTTTRWNNIILVNTTTQAVAVTLATNTGNISKETIVVKVAGGNPVTVNQSGGVTLLGTNNTISDIGGTIVFQAINTTQTITVGGGGTGAGATVARVATTANGAIATAFANGQVVDSVTLVTNDIILLKNQTTASENGVYRVNAAGAPTRTLLTDATLRQTFVNVSEGTINTNQTFKNSNTTTITVGASAITYVNTTIGAVPNRPGNNVFAVSLTNYAANGSVGTAAATVDISSYFRLIQTTSSISVTLPTPTVIGTRMITFDNDITSSWAITVNGRYIVPGEAALFFFNGAIWKPVSDVLGIVPIPTAAVNGNILTAAASSDVAKIITFQQNTTGITSTLLNPTVATDYKTITLCNLATSLFSITIATTGDTFTLAIGQSVDIQWNGTAWRLLNPAQVLPEFGSIILVNQAFATNVFANSTNGTFTIPSAGTWRLRYDINTDGTGASTNSQIQIANNLGVLVAGTERARGGGVATAQILTAQIDVVTTGATTYTIQGRNGGSGSVTILNTANSTSTISWEKISGFSPVVGQAVNYATLTASAASPVSNTTMTLATLESSLVVSGNLITLKAGEKYLLNGDIGIPSVGTPTSPPVVIYEFQTSAGATLSNQTVGFGSAINGTSGTNNSQTTRRATVIFTPTVDTQVRLQITTAASGGSTFNPSGTVTITQLGTTATIAAPIPKITEIQTSLTFTADPRTKYFIVEGVGGGGGSAGTATGTCSSGAGGGGGYFEVMLTPAQFGASQVVTIGAGGTASLPGSGTDGGAGGTTSIGALCSGTGGGGGTIQNGSTNLSAARGGAGGIWIVNTGVRRRGKSGQHGGGTYVGPANVTVGGIIGVGGDSVLGQGGRPNNFFAGATNFVVNAVSPFANSGGGASGNGNVASGSQSIGANGGSGVVFITEYFA